jgi:hypothetical protein
VVTDWIVKTFVFGLPATVTKLVLLPMLKSLQVELVVTKFVVYGLVFSSHLKERVSPFVYPSTRALKIAG